MTLIEGFRDAREKYGEPKNERLRRSGDYIPGQGDCSTGNSHYTFGAAYGRRKTRCVCPICGTRVDCSRDDCAECGSTEPGVWC